MYESNNIEDGLPVFGIEETFQISGTVYVLTDDADDALLLTLADHGYRVTYTSEGAYIARLSHQQTQSEIAGEFIKAQGRSTDNSSSYIVTLEYKNKPRLQLSDLDIHTAIISSASQRSDISYYNRDGDHMSDLVIGRMSAFVKHLVDIPYETWEHFLSEARYDHAQDFIRRMAHWASVNSDQTLREVKYDGYALAVTVDGSKAFEPIKSDRSLKPFFRR
jgi:hypothetical protein